MIDYITYILRLLFTKRNRFKILVESWVSYHNIRSHQYERLGFESHLSPSLFYKWNIQRHLRKSHVLPLYFSLKNSMCEGA